MHGQTSDEAMLQTLGGRIRAARKAKGLRLGAVASEIELSRTSFSQWEADAVRNPDVAKLGKFAKLVDVSLDWLLEQKGGDPDLTVPVRAASRRRSTDVVMTQSDGQDGAGTSRGEALIPEVAPSLAAHAKQIDRTPRALWAIPHQVLEIGFNAEPKAIVVTRVTARSSEFGLGRGDYVLLDTSRTRIDEPGTYLVADPDGISALRVKVIESDGRLEIAAVEDDMHRASPQATVDNLSALGRIMGVLKAS